MFKILKFDDFGGLNREDPSENLTKKSEAKR